MLEEPQIADCWRIAKTRNLVLVPYFISDGLHVSEDIPVLLGGAALPKSATLTVTKIRYQI